MLHQVGEKIGQGAFGSVWEAQRMADGSKVALKAVFPDPDLDAEDIKRGERASDEKLLSFRRVTAHTRAHARTHAHAYLLE
jgi:serine/threonine protein kinase